MATETNRQWVLDEKPSGEPSVENFSLKEEPVRSPGPSELLVKTLYVSVDPYMRGRMGGEETDEIPEWSEGDVIGARGVGEVVSSNHGSFDKGDVVFGYLNWVDYNVIHGSEVELIDPEIAPISTALGVLGATGRTAYHGLLDVARPKPGDQVVVSGAAGAVGSVVGQIAKLAGCRVTGIAGSNQKTTYLTDDLGFDEAINYDTTPDMDAAIATTCPDGVDVYFDNVGGPITDAVIAHLNRESRIAICGQIALYNEEGVSTGPRQFSQYLFNETRVEGFRVSSFEHRKEEATHQLATWVADGKLKYKETVSDGLESAPEAFLGLFKGENIGKQLVKVRDWPAESA